MSETVVRGARGGAVSILAQLVTIAIQFASVAVLSRILNPSDFGLVAMVAAFVSLGEMLRDFGTSVVGLQRKELTHQESSNLFWLSTALGLVATAVLIASTPLIEALYDEPRLGPVVPALALGILLNSMASQLQVQISRAMRFRRLAIAEVSGRLAGFGLAVALAVAGLGYWALVVQAVATAAFGLAARAIAARWKPSRPRRNASNQAMVRDSAAFGFAQLLTYVSQNLDTVAIGARWNAATLGYYNRAFQLLTLPLNALMAPLTRVVVPTVNRAEREGRGMDSVLLPAQFAIGTVVVMMYSVLAGTAGWVVPFVLGSNWGEVVPLFRILALGGCFWAFSRVSYWVFVVRNLGRELLLYNLVSKLVASALILGASFVSVQAVAWAVSAGFAISWPLNLYWLSRFGGHNSVKYFYGAARTLVAGGAAFCLTWYLSDVVLGTAGPLLRAMSAPAGVAFFLALTLITGAGRADMRRAAVVARRSIRG